MSSEDLKDNEGEEGSDIPKLEDKKEDKASPFVAMNSLVGLIIIALAVVYGLPYLTETLDGLTGKKAVTTEENGEKVDQKETKTIAKVEVIEDPKHSEKTEKSIDAALKEAIWSEKRGEYVFIRAKKAKTKNIYLATFSFQGNTYDLKFTYDEDFDHYEALINDMDLSELFSKNPKFETPQ